MNKYTILKLVTGEEIIGKVTKSVEEYVTLTDPFVIKTQWTPKGELQMGLIPFFPYADQNTIVVERTGYSVSCTPVDALVKEYTKQTSGILLP